MEVTREDVLRCAELARLQLTEAEIPALQRDMARILTHAQSLLELDLEGVEPTLHGLDLPLPRREDEPRTTFTQAEALAQAPDSAQGHFVVPKVL
ncbi:MAG TPA: Asp-tRNA(Asn)/Glu-tRNA(Gln) amidotransferase subunit GatC [Holophagaceae bacterium]|nr:Asp-tRNA(Asn)/Glu-tRNA(Gln) amidotransferase subunit GatC [Holophagaceae bacterium]